MNTIRCLTIYPVENRIVFTRTRTKRYSLTPGRLVRLERVLYNEQIQLPVYNPAGQYIYYVRYNQMRMDILDGVLSFQIYPAYKWE